MWLFQTFSEKRKKEEEKKKTKKKKKKKPANIKLLDLKLFDYISKPYIYRSSTIFV